MNRATRFLHGNVRSTAGQTSFQVTGGCPNVACRSRPPRSAWFPTRSLISLAWVLAAATATTPAAHADMIQFVGLSADYTFQNRALNVINKKSAVITDASAMRGPADLGLNESKADPAFAGLLAHSVSTGADDAFKSLTLQSARMLEEGTAQRLHSGFADINIDATFKIVGTPGMRYTVSENDLLKGSLRTTVDMNVPNDNALARVSFTSPITNSRYDQTIDVNEDASHFTITRKFDGKSVEKQTPDFQFAANSNTATVNYDSGYKEVLTTGVLATGTLQFTLTYDLDTFVRTYQPRSTALSDFDPGEALITLRLAAVPEPGLLSLVGVAVLLVALRAVVSRGRAHPARCRA